jgi:thioredoxin reductase (NADPH)
MQDILIVGKGPAGLTAAIYVCRAGLKAGVIGRDAGSLARAEAIENYFGLPKPMTGLNCWNRSETGASAGCRDHDRRNHRPDLG